MPSTNSGNRLVVTVLKRAAGALMALIGGLLIFGIGVFVIGLLAHLENPDIGLSIAFLVIYFAFLAAVEFRTSSAILSLALL